VLIRVVLGIAALIMVGGLAWQGVMAGDNPDPASGHISPTVAILDIGVLLSRVRHEAGCETMNSGSREYFSPATGLER
jgi:hypothetical protein